MQLDALPGGDMVRDGIADLVAGRETIAAVAVSIAAPRLRDLGLDVPRSALPLPEHRLYELLAETDPDSAHSRYNAILRRLVSFARAAACAA